MHFADWLEREYSQAGSEPQESATAELCKRIDEAVEALNPATVTVVTDSNVSRLIMPLLAGCRSLAKANTVVIEPGEDNKDINSAIKIRNALEETEATRKSIVVNIGGGLVTDIGGFAAATFKRGYVASMFRRRFLEPWTRLRGKTAINFNGLKNEIGAFHQPSDVIITALPLSSLSRREIASGYAEMLKTGFIADAGLYSELLHMDEVIADTARLEKAMKRCVEIKEEVVAQDPTEKGLRKILNFGHTAGHAFESLAIERHQSLTHGEAVATVCWWN